jgi:(p)ppGpp synthase/HD superfamily hydrolase
MIDYKTEGPRLLKLAMSLAIESHFGQVDKQGHPYIYHTMAVARLVKIEDLKLNIRTAPTTDDKEWTSGLKRYRKAYATITE